MDLNVNMLEIQTNTNEEAYLMGIEILNGKDVLQLIWWPLIN